MPRLLDADLLGPVTGNLTLPYRGGAGGGALAFDGADVTVPSSQRHPVLLLRLRRSLVDERLVVHPRVDGVDLPAVVFAPFTLEGATLPVYAPATTTDVAGPFAVRLVRVLRQVGDAAFSPTYPATGALDPEDVVDLLEPRLSTGVIGKLAVVGALEKQRLIRHAREVQASRALDLARRWPLDAHGIEHGVPRRTDLDESDARYRTRLAVFRRFRLPTPGGFAAALNGPGEEAEANAGLPALAGVTDRFRVVEEINPLSVALKLVGVGDDSGLDDLHQRLRRDHLLDLRRVAPTALPPGRRAAWEADRRVLRDELTLPSGDSVRWMHPGAARALSNAVRLLRAVGITAQIRLERAYDPDGGSTFELGFGLALRRLSDAQLDRLADRMDDVSGVTGELHSLAAGMTPRPRADDPLGAWFFGACGFATVEEHSSTTVLLSPFPMRGLRIEGPGGLMRGGAGTYRARYDTSSSGGLHALAAAARGRLVEAADAAGVPAPARVVAGEDLTSLLADLATQDASAGVPAALTPLVDAGALSADSPGYADVLITAADLDHAVAVLHEEATVTGFGSGDELVSRVSEVNGAILDAGFSSVLALWDASGGRVAFVASIGHLPGSLSTPGEPPIASYWWSETDVLAGMGSSGNRHPLRIRDTKPSSVTAVGRRPGVGLLAVVGYHRLGLADPYEVRIELDDPASVLDLDQYGYVMNLLDALHPIGIEINTFDLRRRHVDVDGDGDPEWVTSRASRSYHQFRQARWSRRSADRTRQGGP
jgi:hypothetical protein